MKGRCIKCRYYSSEYHVGGQPRRWCHLYGRRLPIPDLLPGEEPQPHSVQRCTYHDLFVPVSYFARWV